MAEFLYRLLIGMLGGETFISALGQGQLFYKPFTLRGLVPSTKARLIRTVGVAFVKLYLRYVRELSLSIKLQLGKPHFGQLWVLCKLLKVW